MNFTSKFTLDFSPLDFLLANLSNRSAQNLLRRAIRRGGNIILAKERALAHTAYGSYLQSLTLKVSAKQDGRVYAVSGPRSNFVRTVGNRVEKPVKYQWFIEKGRQSGRPMPAQHLIRDAGQASPQAERAIYDYIRQEFPKLLRGR